MDEDGRDRVMGLLAGALVVAGLLGCALGLAAAAMALLDPSASAPLTAILPGIALVFLGLLSLGLAALIRIAQRGVGILSQIARAGRASGPQLAAQATRTDPVERPAEAGAPATRPRLAAARGETAKAPPHPIFSAKPPR
ncbi:hypothetical protein [Jannaschia ovalis]|uniref:Holin-X, holin superfamily III n=1 Tax=Jannaschia ovalis TaxID=3038773 RepID=A0ABY8L743_9RHOB|nr:hypothetical protein [Jannaschia sp. GRR-S6-38]WGH77197.1 hypothetical protein P8627_09015 [Jannaschia sp. GRR-S6-38]